MVESRNIEEEIDLIKSMAKEAGELTQAEDGEEEDSWGEEDDDEEDV